MCLPNILFPVFMFAYIFHCHSCIFTLLVASICHFLTAALMFHVFLLMKLVPLFSITRSRSFSVIHVSVNIKKKKKKHAEKDTTLLLFFSF